MVELKKFVFVHIPKTGGQAICLMMKKYKSQKIIHHASKFGHIFNDDCFGLTKENNYDDFFKFSFVRNPWARIVSGWHQSIKLKPQIWPPGSFPKFVNFLSEGNLEMLANSQKSWIMDGDKLLVDYVGNYETYTHDLNFICDVIGIFNTVEKNKKTYFHGKYDYREFYTPELIQKVANLYKDDINYFEYNYE